MPVSLGSLSGVDPATARALGALAASSNRLEALVGQLRPLATSPDSAADREALRLAQQQIQTLQGQVAGLLAAVAALEAGP